MDDHQKLTELCKRSPDVRAALTAWLKHEIDETTKGVVTAPNTDELLKIQGAARGIAALVNKVARW